MKGQRMIVIAGALYLSALAIQFFHLVEHVAQVYQHWWLGLKGQGILFFLDLEWNHFLFNLGYFTLLAWILGALWSLPEWNKLRTRVAVRLFIVAVIIQAYHIIEHTVRMGQYYQYGCTPCLGLLGRVFNLVTLHFVLNTAVWLLPLALLPLLWRTLHTPDLRRHPSASQEPSRLLAS
jgi:hypothetical protein